jgi:hypothetical protein
MAPAILLNAPTTPRTAGKPDRTSFSVMANCTYNKKIDLFEDFSARQARNQEKFEWIPPSPQDPNFSTSFIPNPMSYEILIMNICDVLGLSGKGVLRFFFKMSSQKE